MKIIALALFMTLSASLTAQNQAIDLFVGTYNEDQNADGIHVYAFDPASGALSKRNGARAINASFLTLSSDGKYLYAVNESKDGRGAISAYRYDPQSGALTLLNQQLTQGDGPCHITIDKEGKHVIVSNYAGGSVNVFGVRPNGSLGPLKQVIAFEGSGPDPRRQQQPHVHSAFFGKDEKQVYVQDLGTDKINIYHYRPEAAQPLSPAEQAFVKCSPGGGPRHLAPSTDGRFLYLVQEMAAQVKVYQQHEGRWLAIQETGINESGFKGRNGAADIKLSPDGKFLYASNRGDANTLAIYAVDPVSGKLRKVGNQSVLGQVPRNFNITPDGRFLLVANQDSDEIVVFKRDPATGLLEDSGMRASVSRPVCLVF